MTKYNYMSGSDINYMDDLYSKYKSDPHSVDISWQKFFEGFDSLIFKVYAHIELLQDDRQK